MPNKTKPLCSKAWRGSDRSSPIDSFKQHRQLCRGECDATSGGLRPHEMAVFETLCEQAQAIAIEPQYLDAVATPATKHEYLAREGIGIQLLLDERCEPVEAATHIGVASGDPDARTRRWRDHRNHCARKRRKVSASGRPSIRSRVSPRSSRITAGCVAEFGIVAMTA